MCFGEAMLCYPHTSSKSCFKEATYIKMFNEIDYV